MIYNGGNLLFAIGQNNLDEATKTTATGVRQMRRAVHDISFTKVNSNAMNDIAPGSIITIYLAQWQIGGYIVIGVTAAAFLAVCLISILRLVKTKKENA